MTQFRHHLPNNPFSQESAPKQPQISLLTEKQWAQVKKRFKMTPREYQIARLVCSGMGNEEIAEKLQVMLGTVKTHIRNIYRKTWVNNKISMLLRFAEETPEIDIVSQDVRC